MENFLITIAYLLTGMGFRRLRAFPEQTGVVLNLVVIYLSLPALILLKVPELRFSSQLLVPVLLPWLMLATSAGLVLWLARFLAWDRPTIGCFLLLVPLGNTGFLGIPMVKAFFGEAAIPYALLYDQFGSFLALSTYGSFILALYGNAGQLDLAGMVRKIVLFPPFLALLAALLLRNFPYPGPVASLLQALAGTLVPLVMIAVGYQLVLRLAPGVLGQVGVGLTIKLVVAPLLAIVLCRLAGLTDQPVQVAIFEAGMPPMVTAGGLAIMAGFAPELTAALVGLGIVFSFATLPMLKMLL